MPYTTSITSAKFIFRLNVQRVDSPIYKYLIFHVIIPTIPGHKWFIVKAITSIVGILHKSPFRSLP